MKRIYFSMNIGMMFSMLILGCSIESPHDYGSHCQAEYVLEPNGNLCKGDSCKYRDNLNNGYCPPEAPLCILDNDDVFYCGSQCPANMHLYAGAARDESQCEVDSEEHCGSHDNHCLKADGHKGWYTARCNSYKQCEVTSCQDAYIFTGDSCLTASQCCGDFCKDCTRGGDMVCSGSNCESGCKDGEIRCENSCIDPMTSQTYCGSSALCEIKQCNPDQKCDNGICICKEGIFCDEECVDPTADIHHCGSCENDCASDAGWRSGECLDSKCKVLVCNTGYHQVANADGSITCKQDSEMECGDALTNCTAADHWVSGSCVNALCKAESCDAGYYPYESQCIETSDEKCGPDQVPCGPYQHCDKTNKCVCDSNYTMCGNTCYSLSESIANCGKCGVSCAVPNAVNICHNGQCAIKECRLGYVLSSDKTECEPAVCNDNDIRCDGQKYQTCQDNQWHTVETCTTVINNADPVCSKAAGCSYQCNANYSDCDGQCYNLKTDINHCGDCQTKCNIANASNTCSNGKCSFECNDNYIQINGRCDKFVCNEGDLRCSGLIPQICENNQWKNKETCTTTVKNASAVCVGGSCSFECNAAYTQCNGQCVDLMSDVNNCKTCGNQCNAPNANNLCSNGVCVIESCMLGYRLMNGSCVKEVCTEGEKICDGPLRFKQCIKNLWLITECTAPENGISTCSVSTGCGKVCDNSSWTLCNGNACYDTKSNNSHCGACNSPCNTSIIANSKTVACSASKCTATACSAGYHVYNGACEQNTDSNCGAHGKVCNTSSIANSASVSCSSDGVCTVNTCSSGYYKSGNACLPYSESHCGPSGAVCNVLNAINKCVNGACTFTCNTGYTKYKGACYQCADSLEVLESGVDTITETCITGELYIKVTSAKELKFPNLLFVGGLIHCTQPMGATVLEFPKLETVGSIELFAAYRLIELNLNALTSLGHIALNGNTAMTKVSIPNISALPGGAMNISGNRSLTTLNFASLGYVGGAGSKISNNNNLTCNAICNAFTKSVYFSGSVSISDNIESSCNNITSGNTIGQFCP